MCRPRSLSDEQISKIRRIAISRPACTASQMAGEVGGRESAVKFYLAKMRASGEVPRWAERPSTERFWASLKPMSQQSRQAEINQKVQFREFLVRAEARWSELMAGRSYA